MLLKSAKCRGNFLYGDKPWLAAGACSWHAGGYLQRQRSVQDARRIRKYRQKQSKTMFASAQDSRLFQNLQTTSKNRKIVIVGQNWYIPLKSAQVGSPEVIFEYPLTPKRSKASCVSRVVGTSVVKLGDGCFLGLTHLGLDFIDDVMNTIL